MDMHQVDLGFIKFEATRQSIIAFIFSSAFILLSIGVSIIPLYKAGMVSTGFLIVFGIFFAAIAILCGILYGYSINCMVVGKCIKLSWVFSGFYVLLTVLYFIIFVASVMSGSSLPQTPISTTMGHRLTKM